MSMTAPCPDPGTSPSNVWYREYEVALLIGLVVGAYFLRVGAVPIQGEEPTRAQIAFEMVESGDWIVPHQQGIPFLTRPPLQNWLIAASCLAFRTWDGWAVRFHSLLATLLTTLLIYGYARISLSRLGAFAAAAGFATMAHMFTKGYQAETDALFIFLVSGSLLLWHWGVMRSWPDIVTFALGYGFMALGMMTKGLQAPFYFVGAIGVYLLLTGQWRRLFGVGHLAGILVGASIIAAWLAPFGLRLGWPAAYAAFMGDGAMTHNTSLEQWNWKETALHWLTFPFEVWLAILPWSLMLLPYLSKSFRQSIGEARPQVKFLAICVAVAFPTCWLPSLGLVRYFAPLYPCLAVLIGVAIERCVSAEAISGLRTFWRGYLILASLAMAMMALTVVALSVIGMQNRTVTVWGGPPLAAIAYAATLAGLAVLAYRVRAAETYTHAICGVAAVSLFMTVMFTGVLTDIRARRSEDTAHAVRRLKEKLPAGQPLVSFGGNLDCLFPYYYGSPIITPKPWPKAGVAPEAAYFCFVHEPINVGAKRPTLPFEWVEIDAIPLDRFHHAAPERVVVVGRIQGAIPQHAGR